MGLNLRQRRNKWYRQGTILHATGNTSGDWQKVEGLFPLVINVDGDFSGTVSLYTSTADDAPSDADANHGVLKTFTGPDVYVLDAGVEWVKATLTSFVSGSATVTAEASER